MKNKKALIKTLDYIQLHPKKLNMYSWKCGTGACVIGHYCRMNPKATLKLRKVFGRIDSTVVHCMEPVLFQNGKRIATHGEAIAGHFDISTDMAEKMFKIQGADYNDITDQRAGFCADKCIGRIKRLIAKL